MGEVVCLSKKLSRKKIMRRWSGIIIATSSPAFPSPALTSFWSKGRRGEEGRKIHAFLSHYNTTQTKSSMHYLAGGPGRKKYRNLKIPPLNSYAEPSSFYMSAYGGDKKIPLTPSTAP